MNSSTYKSPIKNPWFAWFLVAFLYLLQYGLLVFPSIISESLKESLHLTDMAVGFFSSAFLYTYVLMQIPAGLLYDRYDAKKILIFSIACIIVGSLLLTLSQGFHLAFWSRLLMGFGGSFAFIGALYLGKGWFPAVLFPIIIALTEGMSGVGSLSFGAVFAFLTPLYGWRMLLLGIIALLVILGFLMMFFVKDTTPKVQKTYSAVKDLAIVFNNRRIWLWALYTGFIVAYFAVMTNMWEIPFLELNYQLSDTGAFLENAFTIIGFLVGSIVIGFLHRYISPYVIILFCAILQLLLVLLVSYVTLSLFLLSIVLFLIGFTVGSAVLGFDEAKKAVDVSHYGVASGLINMFFAGVGIISLPIVGYLLELSHENFQIAAIPIVFSSFMAIIMAFILCCSRDVEVLEEVVVEKTKE